MAKKLNAKIFNIANYQRNANQNYNEVLSHISKNGNHKKIIQTINAGMHLVKSELFYSINENLT